MKKYLQISTVLGVLGLLIFLKQESGSTSLSNATAIKITTNQPGLSSKNKTKFIYKDGTYIGSVEDAYYGNVQVKVSVLGGKLSDITVLQYPNDNHTSERINSQALPNLVQEAIAAQSASINGVSGASATTPAFIASLTDALNQAK